MTDHPRPAETSGLRIARKHPRSDSLAVRAVQGPEPEDVVIERGEGRLFLGRGAVGRVRGKVLDARDDPHGRIVFVLKPA